MRSVRVALLSTLMLAACGDGDDPRQSYWAEEGLNNLRPGYCGSFELDPESPACDCAMKALVHHFRTPMDLVNVSGKLTPEVRAYNADILACGGATSLDALWTINFSVGPRDDDTSEPTTTG